MANGAKAIAPSPSLSRGRIAVEGLTLRTPTLDDVFLRKANEWESTLCAATDSVVARRAPRSAGGLEDSAASPCAVLDMARPEHLSPALGIPVFFFVVNAVLQSLVETASTRLRLKRFQLPVAVVRGDGAVVTSLVMDIQNGYFIAYR